MDEFVKKEDAYRHSMWLSFMSERLNIAYDLLKEDGLIFLSIDDNEFSQLKILMDEIFTEENFVISMPRITKKSGKTTTAYAKIMIIFSVHKRNTRYICNGRTR